MADYAPMPARKSSPDGKPKVDAKQKRNYVVAIVIVLGAAAASVVAWHFWPDHSERTRLEATPPFATTPHQEANAKPRGEQPRADQPTAEHSRKEQPEAEQPKAGQPNTGQSKAERRSPRSAGTERNQGEKRTKEQPAGNTHRTQYRRDDEANLDAIPGDQFVPGQLVIQYKRSATAKQILAVRQLLKAELKEELYPRASESRRQEFTAAEGGGAPSRATIDVVSLPEEPQSAPTDNFSAASVQPNWRRTIKNAIRRIKKHPAIAFAEPLFVYSAADGKVSGGTGPQNQGATFTPSKYYSDGKLWGLYSSIPPSSANANEQSDYGIGADSAWANKHMGSREVYVGVVDTGVEISHVDLTGNIFNNQWELANGKDNDGNGYAGDLHGWNFYQAKPTVKITGNSDVTPSLPNDSAHGTHVAGIVGASGDDPMGTMGVDHQVTIIPVRFLGPEPLRSGTSVGAALALDYLTDLKTRHHLKLVAINCSWAGYGYSKELLGAIKRAANARILIITAAGNFQNNNDTKKVYPGAFDVYDTSDGEKRADFNPIITVAAIAKDGSLASDSDFGQRTVDLAAPGVEIYSTVPGNTYLAMDGTSMAAPFVTGAAALYAASHPQATAQDIKNALVNSFISTTSLKQRVHNAARLNISSF